MFDKLFNTPAGLCCERDSYLTVVQRRIDHSRYAVSQGSDRAIPNGTVAELIDPTGAFHQRHARRMVDTEFSFKSRLRGFLAGELHDERMNFQFHAIDFIGR